MRIFWMHLCALLGRAMSKQSLNLSLEKSVIERAKRYSRRHDTSVSRLVGDFLARLPADEGVDAEGLSPTVRRLIGAGAGADESAYREYLTKKYGR